VYHIFFSGKTELLKPDIEKQIRENAIKIRSMFSEMALLKIELFVVN